MKHLVLALTFSNDRRAHIGKVIDQLSATIAMGSMSSAVTPMKELIEALVTSGKI